MSRPPPCRVGTIGATRALGTTRRRPAKGECMQALQLDEQRSMTTPTLPDAESDDLSMTIRYLSELSESLWLSARSVSSARSLLALDGATPGAVRIRRARQAAAI